jgi:hypothetical protein
MRRKQQQTHVRTITTGHVEADMLGKVYLWVSERSNRKYPQRPHRTYKRKVPPKSIFRVITEWSLTAPTACWRRLKAWQDKKNARVPKYLSGLRKQKRNGN